MTPRARITISLDPELSRQIRDEANRDGVDVSTWLSELARAEATRRAYAEELADRQAAGIYSEKWLDEFAARRAATMGERSA